MYAFWCYNLILILVTSVFINEYVIIAHNENSSKLILKLYIIIYTHGYESYLSKKREYGKYFYMDALRDFRRTYTDEGMMEY